MRPLFALLCSALVLPYLAAEEAPSHFSLQENADCIRFLAEGKMVTAYWKNPKAVPGGDKLPGSKPFFYPVIGPGEVPLSRAWPMEKRGEESSDHPHHRGIWWGHGVVNGLDFWTEGAKSGRIEHDKTLAMKAGDSAAARFSSRWLKPDGTLVCQSESTLEVKEVSAERRVLDFSLTFLALPDHSLKLGDTKEAVFGFRAREEMTAKGGGRIVLSSGLSGPEAFGGRGHWGDISGKVDGKPFGAALMNHPENYQTPTWWFARDYGLLGVNPFGLHDFAKKPVAAGDMVIPAGGSLTLRYRLVLHTGDESAAKIAELWGDYSRPTSHPSPPSKTP